MRAGRYDFAAGGQAVRWPFAVHELSVTPLIAPEFRASFQSILTTSRSYFHLERELEREARKRGLPHR
jgi:hypothetical protein